MRGRCSQFITGGQVYQHVSKKLKKDLRSGNSTQNEDEEDHVGRLNFYIKDSKVIQLLKSRGILRLFPIQQSTFQPLFQGHDLIARDRTGSGKTLAFLLPILQRMREKGPFQHRAPRELCLQVYRVICSLKIYPEEFKVLAVYGGSDMHSQIYILKQGVDLIICTPGRFLDLLMKGHIQLQLLQTVCLDEADQMLNLGFSKQIRKIFRYFEDKCPNTRQVILFSATIPQWLATISKEFQHKNVITMDLVNSTQNQTSKTVNHYCLEKICNFNAQKILKYLITEFGNIKGRTLIFCQTKQQVNQLITVQLSIPTGQLHGNIPQIKRQETFQKFRKGVYKCLIATNVAARGLDFPNVQLVIQMQPPKQTDTYIHRSGRTGRNGQQGICITLFNKTNKFSINKIQKQANIKFTEISPNQLTNTPQHTNSTQSSKRHTHKQNCSIFVGSLPKFFTEQNLKSMLKYYKIIKGSPNNAVLSIYHVTLKQTYVYQHQLEFKSKDKNYHFKWPINDTLCSL